MPHGIPVLYNYIGDYLNQELIIRRTDDLGVNKMDRILEQNHILTEDPVPQYLDPTEDPFPYPRPTEDRFSYLRPTEDPSTAITWRSLQTALELPTDSNKRFRTLHQN
jgi:hypothetical protein